MANDVILTIAFDLYISKYSLFCHRKNPAISNGFLDFLGLLWILLDYLLVGRRESNRLSKYS